MGRSRFLLIFLALTLCIISSQCTSPVQITTGGGKKTRVQGRDLLKIEKIGFYPSNKLSPGQILDVRISVKNVGQEPVNIFIDPTSSGGGDHETKSSSCGSNGSLLLSFCQPMFKLQKFEILGMSKDKCKGKNVDINFDGKKEEITTYDLDPGAYSIFSWEIKAPSEGDIMNMRYKCDFNVHVSYASTAETITYIYFINKNELNERVYTQKDMSLAGNNIATKGPVYAEIVAPQQPYPYGDPFSLELTVKNIGRGVAKINNIVIKYPSGYFQPDMKNCQFFINDGDKLVLDLKSAKPLISIFQGKSSTFVCQLKPIKDSLPLLTPFKFVTNVSYVYSYIKNEYVYVIPYGRE